MDYSMDYLFVPLLDGLEGLRPVSGMKLAVRSPITSGAAG